MPVKTHASFIKSLCAPVVVLGLVGLAMEPVRAAGSQLIVNGSFESDYAGWVASGNQFIESMASYAATDGVKLVSFNGNATSDLPPNAVLSQTFATTEGTTYTLVFDMGVIGSVSGEQRLEISVEGTANLLTQVRSKLNAGGSGAQWSAESYTFVADSAQTTLTFRDVSTVTTGVDALLDNVQVTANAPLQAAAPYGLNLVWDAAPEGNVTDHRVYVGTQSQQYTAVYATGGVAAYSLTGLEFGQTYYLAVSAVSNTGLEGPLSAELAVTIAPPPLPMGSRLKSTTNGGLALEWTLPTSAMGSSPKSIVQASPDLVNWTNVATVLASDSVGSDGQSQRFSWSVPSGGGKMFYRLTAENWLGSSTAP